jgi:hypothetical protein
LVLVEQPGCRSYSTVALYRINGGGHQWFGGDPLANPLFPVLGLDPRQIKTSAVVWDVIGRYALRRPRFKWISGRCPGSRRLHVRVAVSDDSPLRRLSVAIDGRRVLKTKRTSLDRRFRLKQCRTRRHRVVIGAIDRAGLHEKHILHLRPRATR